MYIFANRVLHSPCGALSLIAFSGSALLPLSVRTAGYTGLGFLWAHRSRMLRRFLLRPRVRLRRCLSLCWPPRFVFAGPRFSCRGRTLFRFPRSRPLCKFRCGFFLLFLDLFLWRFFDAGKFSQQFHPVYGVAALPEELLLKQLLDALRECRASRHAQAGKLGLHIGEVLPQRPPLMDVVPNLSAGLRIRRLR